MDQIVSEIDALQFDRIDKDLSHDEFNRLLEVNQVFNLSNNFNFKNSDLLAAFSATELNQTRYFESQAAGYDPLKPKIVSALAQSFTKANVNYVHTA